MTTRTAALRRLLAEERFIDMPVACDPLYGRLRLRVGFALRVRPLALVTRISQPTTCSSNMWCRTSDSASRAAGRYCRWGGARFWLIAS
jgi:hypothetical protein